MSNRGAHASGSSSDAIRSLVFTAKERKVLSNYTAPPPNRHHSPGVVSQLVNRIEQKTSPTSTTSRKKKKTSTPPLAQIDDLELLEDDVERVEEPVNSPRRKKYMGNHPLGNLKILHGLLPGTSKDPPKEASKESNKENLPSGKKLKKCKSKSRVEPEEEEPAKLLRLKRTLTDSTNNHTPASSTWRQMFSSALGGPLKKRLSEGTLLPAFISEEAKKKKQKKPKEENKRLQRQKSAGEAKDSASGGGGSSSFFGALIRLSHSAASLTSLTSLASLGGSPSSSRSNTKEFKEPPAPTLVTQASTSCPSPPDSPPYTVPTAAPIRELRKSKTCQITPDRPPIIPSITITETRSLTRIDRCRPVTVDGSPGGLTAERRNFVSRRSTMSRTMSLIPTSPSLPPLYEEETASTAAMVDEETKPEQKRRMRRYGGSNTTSTYQGRKDVAPDASPRRHLIGFLHRTSHLSLTSELSANASFYLIGHRRHLEESTIGSESDARVFSDDDDRGSTTTDFTSVSRQHEKMAKKKKAKRNFRKPSRASSFSSITESSMSLDVITVNLNMDTVNFLGISIVGQTSNCGDNGIYVANIMKGGAVALDGRIEAGDMILQVNEVSFENFTNDQAVDVLREAVSRRGPIKLTVAKSFENGAQSCFTIPRNSREEPVRPIDTQAWIQHTNAMRGMPSIVEESAPTPIPGEWPHGRPPSSSTVTSNGSNGQNTVVTGGAHIHLDIHTDKKKVVEIMAMPGSGLDIKNRTWLKIPIPMSFLGSDLVDWLLEHVEGLRERKTARNYAADLLKLKYIAHVVNKVTFTEQCYYVLGDECSDYARFRNEDGGPKYQWTIGMNGMNGMSQNGGSVLLPPPHHPGPSGFKGMAPSMVSDGESRMYVMHI